MYNQLRGLRTVRMSALMAGASLVSVLAATAPAGAQDENFDVEEVVITGSRIVRRDYTSPSPVATVGQEQVATSGAVTVEQILNEMPQLQAANTSNVNAPGGSGTLTADLRGLGSARTLVLVNGRRFAPSGAGGVVDLASVPQALIDRVEVVTGGASAVYGSDAIAGVVNFILKDDFEGMEAAYSYGFTEHGGGETHNAEITMGTGLGDGRGNAVLFASYTKQDPVFQSQRAHSETALFEEGDALVPGGSSRVPGTAVFGSNLIYPDGIANPGCDDSIGAIFGEGGQPGTFCWPADAYNFAAPNYLLRPRDRWQITGSANYEITDNITAFGEAFYMNTVNNLQQAPAAVDFEIVPGTATLPVPLNNPLLPRGVRDFLAANFDEDGDGVATLVGARRRFLETGSRQQIYDRNSFQVVGGLKGDVEGYNWELFYQYGRTSTDEELKNLVSNLRVAQGLDVVVDDDGNVTCRNETFGCVPLNIFGFDSITPEAAAFVTPTAFSKTVASRQVIGGSIAGDVFDLPAGAVGVAVGFEYRKESARYSPDATIQSGELGSGSDGLPLSGDFDLWEVFAETRVPLIADAPFAHYLGLEAAVRYSDYSSIGGVFTFKAGGEWAPVADLRFRALFQRAVRAPNLGELYAGQASGAVAYSDPCDVDRNPSEAVRNFCIAQGIPADTIDNFQEDDVTIGVFGGNPDLMEERSDTYTVGFVFQPSAVPGFSLSADYYSVDVDDAISSIGVQTTIDLCFDALDLNDPACQRIGRISNGKMNRVQSFNANIARFSVKGLDVQADYVFDLPDSVGVGGNSASLKTRALGSWQFQNEFVPFEGEAPTDCAGKFGGGACSGQGIPIVLGFKALVGMDYRSGPLGVSLQGRYQGSVDPINADNVIDKIDARIYADMAVSYQVSENVELMGIIDNLFDTKPPVIGFGNGGDTNSDPAVYDPLGRRFMVKARFSF
ncbi:TonB-dependent receptor plug domain-containing protein [Kordiimonas lacus]|uniref:TonB-dependent Receptor Plug Domain n=1 Tax=Kordiimonas lacus TaxID=637679 RepID=A0A1G6ZHQ5_9PROT|nr:TonB-dependent receptor [Kordiimonas lacus]SDE02021.1 TonB-dependent Receptor Plug Domain [Kordiimonas lacus]